MATTTVVRDRLSRVRDELDALNIGKHPYDLSMQVAMPPRWASNFHAHSIRSAAVVAELVNGAARVYAQALRNPELAWLVDAFETPLSRQAVALSRAAAARSPLSAATTVRPDFIDFHTLAEVQVQGAGLGLLVALENVFRGRPANWPTRLLVLHARAIRTRTRKREPRVLMMAHDYGLRETAFYCHCLRRLGIKADAWHALDASEQFRPGDYDLVLWKGGVDELLENPALRLLVDEANTRDTSLAPMVSCLRLSKLNLLLPFLPQTGHFYSDRARELLPVTRLLHGPGARDVADLSRSALRNLVLKYAGQRFELTTGSRGVLMLGRSRGQDRKLLDGIAGQMGGSAWLLQERRRTRFEVTYLDRDDRLVTDEMSARLNPRFVVDGSGQLVHGGALAIFSKDYKAHGGESNAITWLP